MYLGEIKIGNNLTIYCNTHTPSTGAAVDADAVPGYRCYEDLTTAPLLTGNTALHDGDNTVGFYSAQLAITAANGFEAGKCYCVRITGVVGGVTGVELHTFTVAARATDDLAFPTTTGRSIDVTATGAVGVDWANVEGPTTTVGLSGTTVKAVTDGVSLSTSERTTLYAGIVAALTAATAYLAAIAAAVWAYATRTLTSTAAATTSAVSGSTLTLTAYTSYAATLSGMTIPSDWLKIWLTVKEDEGDTDAESIIQLAESNPGVVTDGLLYLNGAASTASYGSLTVSQAAGTVAIALAYTAGVSLPRKSALGYDVACLSTAAGKTILTSGTAIVNGTETRAVA